MFKSHLTQNTFYKFQIVGLLISTKTFSNCVDLGKDLELRRNPKNHFLEKLTSFPSQKFCLGCPLKLVPLDREQFSFGNEVSEDIDKTLKVVFEGDG